MSVSWVLHMRCFKCVLDLNEVQIATLRISDILVVWVEFEPLMHVVKCILLGQLVCEADSKSE